MIVDIDDLLLNKLYSTYFQMILIDFNMINIDIIDCIIQSGSQAPLQRLQHNRPHKRSSLGRKVASSRAAAGNHG